MLEAKKKNNGNEELLGSAYMGRTKIRPDQPNRQLPPGLLTGLVLVVFAGIIWYSYPGSESQMQDMDVPVVRADASAVAEVPEDPSGMEVRHQDSTIFSSIEGQQDSAKVERILPKAEEPVNKEVVLESTGLLNGFAEMPRTATLPAAEAVEPKAVAAKPVASKPETAAATIAMPKEKPVIKDIKEAAAPQREVVSAVPDTLKDTYIQLGSYREKTDAAKDWFRLKKKYGDLLDGLDMKTVQVDLKAKGIYYRLHAGEVTAFRANTICTEINKQKSGACLVVK